MLSRNFRLQKVGDLKWLKKNYNFSKIAFSIDELIVLDVSRHNRDEKKFCQHIKSLTEECFVPISAGGGIRTIERAKMFLRSGADKIVVNSLLDTGVDVIKEIASEFGKQCLIASVDVMKSGDKLCVWTENGTKKQKLSVKEWIEHIVTLPIGEIYLNSIDRDGTGQGFLIDLLDILPNPMYVPIILAGGAGQHIHLSNGLNEERVDAVATAHLFNFVGDGLQQSRRKLLEEGFDLPKWDIEKAKSLEGMYK